LIFFRGHAAGTGQALVIAPSLMEKYLGAANGIASQLPVVLLGSGGDRIKGGRVRNDREKSGRQMCRL